MAKNECWLVRFSRWLCELAKESPLFWVLLFMFLFAVGAWFASISEFPPHEPCAKQVTCIKNGQASAPAVETHNNKAIDNKKWCENTDDEQEVADWFYYITAVATALLAVIAWVQIKQLVERKTATFYLSIDDRWGSEPILKGRRILYNKYLELAKPYHPTPYYLVEPEICRKMTEELCKMGEEWEARIEGSARKNKKKLLQQELPYDDFIYILNLLDFIETVGSFYARKLITQEELEALSGESLLFYCRLLKGYARYRDSQYSNLTMYKNFIKLYDALKKQASTTDTEST